MLQIVGLAFGMVYVASSIAGAGIGLAQIVLLAMFCLVIVSFVVLGSSLGWDTFIEALRPMFKAGKAPRPDKAAPPFPLHAGNGCPLR